MKRAEKVVQEQEGRLDSFLAEVDLVEGNADMLLGESDQKPYKPEVMPPDVFRLAAVVGFLAQSLDPRYWSTFFRHFNGVAD